MKSLILALATALPQYSLDQTAIAQKVIQMLDLTDQPAQFIEKLYNKTEIKRRYSVLKDIESSPENYEFFHQDFLNNIPGTEKRNDIYIEQAPKLVIKAAQAAIEQWGRKAQEITHVISVSCTGVMAPGIEFIVQHELNLLPTTQRIGINFMGCFGAFRGLAVANAIAQENPHNRVLLVCTELCSLHFQVSLRPDVLIGNALFGDGSAAAIIGAQTREQEKPLWSIAKCGSYALPNTQDKMTWTLSDQGCVMSLSSDIPKIIEQNAPDIITSFIPHKQFADITWAIHPGGKAIIQAIERSCALTKQQTKASWRVLNNYGNMSSATFLFVLKELAQEIDQHKSVIGLGFGPGLSLETLLLEN